MSSPSWSVAVNIATAVSPSATDTSLTPEITGGSSSLVTAITTMMLSVAPDGSVAVTTTVCSSSASKFRFGRRRYLSGHPVDLEHGRVIAAQRVQQPVAVAVSGRYRISNRRAVVILSNRAHRRVRLVTRRNKVLVGELRSGVRGIANLHARYRRPGGASPSLSQDRPCRSPPHE